VSKPPLVANLLFNAELFRHKGIHAWSVQAPDGPISLLLLHFDRRAVAWPRVLEACTERGLSVRPVLDASGKVAILLANTREVDDLQHLMEGVFERIDSKGERHFYNTGWLAPNAQDASRRNSRRGIGGRRLVWSVAAFVSVALGALAVGSLAATSSAPTERSDTALKQSQISNAVQKSHKGSGAFDTVRASKDLRECFANSQSSQNELQVQLEPVTSCLGELGYVVDSSNQISIGGVSEILVKFSGEEAAIEMTAVRTNSQWKLKT